MKTIPIIRDDFGRFQIGKKVTNFSHNEIDSWFQGAGVKISKATLSRIMSGECRMYDPQYHQHDGKTRRVLPSGFIRLKSEEFDMSSSDLARRFGITPTTGTKAKNRGWFEVTDPMKIPESQRSRIRGVGGYLPDDLME